MEVDRENPIYENEVKMKVMSSDREDRMQSVTVRLLHGTKVCITEGER